MPLLLAGIDEAGYGPTLGPLCVGMTLFRIRDWNPGDAAPDLWKLLRRGICKKPGDKRNRIPIADSKALKLPNDTTTRHPLIHLERGVLAFLRALACEPGTDQDLFTRLGVTLEDRPWYADPPTDLPLALTPGDLAIAASRIAAALDTAGIDLLDIRCLTIPESAFNDIVRTTGSKSEATAQALGHHLRHILKSIAPAADPPPSPSGPPPSPSGRGAAVFGGGEGSVSTPPTEPPQADTQPQVEGPLIPSSSSSSSSSEISNLKSEISDLNSANPQSAIPDPQSPSLRIICDQLGGRTQYESLLARELGLPVTPLTESGERSRYQFAPESIIQFMPEAESAHLPVALASMVAKLTRELAMLRFNRYWCARCPELKPTAGYSTDARRWLTDTSQFLTPDERTALVRIA